ncbi:conserved hypothetical protein [Theileria equi strain WA]|uniref:Transcription initiation factor TFIID subunit 8 n=1 Tax=Theileria equi strain WA TaxID=1537102 RepID=L1LDM0_THEEQ|nr:conserved hypothetical protein [Theileria equi strain WA]EKX73340.1 conserved hypothetical protein [Theileria equi strain WA]|eukprot:XP_004832792.1 conserved hypothetical protein [Theileria equi strain WA]
MEQGLDALANEPLDESLGSNFKVNKDNVIISLAQSHRSARSSHVIYTQPLESDKIEYYEEWMQKCVAWVAKSCGIKKMDCYSLEKISNFVINEIKAIGRKASYLSKVRGCECSNFIDIMNALEIVNPDVYKHIFTDRLISKSKQLPKQVTVFAHNTLIQPAVLAQPSGLYFECMVNASEHLSELNEEGGQTYSNSGKQKTVRDGESIDLEYFLTYSNRNTYSLKSDECYQQIASSRPKYLHKHMPLLPAEFIFGQESQEASYTAETTKTSDKLTKQNLMLQAELPLLHRVQIQPELQALRSDKA